MDTNTAAHVHTLDCATKMVTTTEGAWTTASAEFACQDRVEAKLDQIEAATQKVRSAELLAGMGVAPWDRERGAKQAQKARAELRALWASVTTTEELVALHAARAARAARDH